MIAHINNVTNVTTDILSCLNGSVKCLIKPDLSAILVAINEIIIKAKGSNKRKLVTELLNIYFMPSILKKNYLLLKEKI